jgi:GTPase
MLEPEIEEGNKEYKRFILNLSPHRFEQLVSQMKWRLEEGEGIAYYFIGVEDDGSIYGISNIEFKNSIKNINKLVKKCKGKIDNVDKIKINDIFYYKVKLISQKIDDKFEEKRILLLGDSGVGKTTFLAYLINNKLNNNSRMFILNHKHELESGKTSSFNYKYLIYENCRYVFLDTPGDKLYNKTLNKILLSIDIDLILYFKGKYEWDYKKLYYEYAINNRINWIELDIYSNINRFPKINMDKPPKQNIIMNYINRFILNKNNKLYSNDVNFIVLQTFPHDDLGWILSGYLKSGKINIGDKLIWYGKEKRLVSIQSIHINNIPVNNVKNNNIITICLDKLKHVKIKPKYGFLSNLHINTNRTIVIKWIYLKYMLNDIIDGYIKNNKIRLKKIGKKSDNIIIYYVVKFDNLFNLRGNNFLFSNGFGKIL